MKTDDPANPEGDLFDIPDYPIERPAVPAAQLIGDWVTLAIIMALLGYIDYLCGYKISLSVFYFIPIIVGTRRLGLLSGILLSVVSVFMRDMADYLNGRPYNSEWIAVWNTFMRLATFLTVTWLTAHYTLLLAQYRAQAAARYKLAVEVKVLEGLLPICTSCRKKSATKRAIGSRWNVPLRNAVRPNSPTTRARNAGNNGRRRLESAA